jgi:hypothetical protein
VKRGAAILMFIRSAFLAIAVALPAMCAGVQLEAGAAPVSVEADGGWLVSFSILNRGDVAAREVEVSAVSIDGANVLTPLPLKLGDLSARLQGTSRVRFGNIGAPRGDKYVMKVAGDYLEGERRHPFSLSYALSTPSSGTSLTRGPGEPPGFASANSGPTLMVPAGPIRSIPIGKETSTAESDLIPVQVKGLWGYAHSRTPSQLVIRPQFTHATPFAEGLAAVSAVGQKWGYIDPSGAFRISAQFNSAAPFAGGVAKVTIGNGKIRYIDAAGAFVTGHTTSK